MKSYFTFLSDLIQGWSPRPSVQRTNHVVLSIQLVLVLREHHFNVHNSNKNHIWSESTQLSGFSVAKSLLL